MLKNSLLTILKKEIKPAIGCTEPVAVALGAAIVADLLQEQVTFLEVKVDPNIYKNGMGVYVPGTKEKGLVIAAALGAIGGKAHLELEVLKDITETHYLQAQNLVQQGRVKVSYIPRHQGVLVNVKGQSKNNQAQVIISKTHTNVVYKELNGEVLLDTTKSIDDQQGSDLNLIKQLTIEQIIGQVNSFQESELRFLEKIRAVNKQIAELGLTRPMGMGVGYQWYNLMTQGIIPKDLVNLCKAYTGAATDARMSGQNLPVMSCAGSGNQGLMASLPVIITGEFLKASPEKLYRALALSFLVTIYVKTHIGRLSAICGCAVAASLGAGAGIGYLWELDSQKIKGIINNIAADISGMVCDGAKPGCALKMVTAIDASLQMAFLAKQGVIIEPKSGIVSSSPEETIRNIGYLSNPGMLETDKTILEIMVREQEKEQQKLA